MSLTARRFRTARNLPLFAFSLLPLVAAGAAQAAGAPVLPTGGKVVAGQASIGAAGGNALTINQSSGKAIINWNGFSIGQGGKVQFNNGSGATLNRVTGTSVSSLNGLLSATGSLYLLNPNGVIVGKSGVVNVGGSFVASTLNVSDANFLAGGDLHFTGNSNAAVVNLGKVGALGGDVALIAASVDNEGAITAANGTAGLVSGYSVIMRDASLDDGMFSVLVGGPKTGVTNGGAIIAANAELRAEQGNVYALAGNTAGVIRATGVKSGQGKVWLVADGGTLDVAGTIAAQGAGGGKGAIETSGHNVTVGAASIDAHGGTWLVDPVDLTINSTAASTIDASLNNGTNVTEQTTATGSSGAGTPNANGNGDIIVAAPISWTTDAGLTLSAYRNVDVNAAIASSGGGAVTLYSDNSGTGTGTVAFNGGSVSTSGAVNIFYNPTGNDPTTVNSTSYTAPTDYSANVSGGGTLSSYMLVNTVYDLQNIQNNLSGTYALGRNIDASSTSDTSSSGFNGGSGFTTLGGASTFPTAFTGVLEGQNYTVTGLTLTDGEGLFGSNAGLIENLTLSGGAVTGSTSNFFGEGGLAGGNTGTINNVNTSMSVTAGGNYTGGLVGQNAGGTIENSSATGTVDGGGYSFIGGLVGYNTSSLSGATGVIYNSFSGGDVSGYFNVGGLVGYNQGQIESSSSGATVTGFDNVGGLVGDNDTSGTIDGGEAEIDVTGSGGVGGLVGENDGAITNSESAFGTISSTRTGDADVGGLVGYNSGSIAGSDTYETSTTASGNSVGAFVGYNDTTGTISGGLAYAASVAGGSGSVGVGGVAGYNAGSVSGENYHTTVTNTGGVSTGGVVGLNYTGATVTGSEIASGVVNGGNATGGLVGKNYGSVTGSSESSGATVTGAAAVGGAVGKNFGLVDGVQVVGGTKVSGGSYVGGLVGYNTVPYGSGAASTAVITDDSRVGASTRVTATGNYVGGLVGYNDVGSIITASSQNGALVQGPGAAGEDIGGMVGYNAGTLSNSDGGFAVVETSANTSGTTDYLGGVVGYNASTGTVSGITTEAILNGSNPYSYTDAAGHVVTSNTVAGGASSTVGGLAGYNAGALTGSTVNTPVTTTGQSSVAGGLVGYNDTTGTIGSSSASGEVTVAAATGGTNSTAGGLVGVNYGAISNASSSSNLEESGTSDGSSSDALGGLVGYNASGSTIANATASGTVAGLGVDDIGGLAGDNFGTISGSSASGAVSLTNSMGGAVGGLIGYNSGTINGAQASFATGTVSVDGTAFAGGLIGFNDSNGSISQAYATGAVIDTGGAGGASDGSNLGGLVGYNLGSIDHAYALGAVTATNAADDTLGGLVGYNSGSISQAYATGMVSAANGAFAMGGVAGENAGTIDATVFWDETTTGQTTAAGIDDAGATDTATAINVGGTLSPYAQSSYAGLDFGSTGFVIFEGSTRPFLRSEASSTIVNDHQLQLMALNLAGNYTLAADIDASDTMGGPTTSGMWSAAGFAPVGTDVAPFTGTLNGADPTTDLVHTISNLYIAAGTSAISTGLFGNVGAGAAVFNVNFTGADISGGNAVGVIAGKNAGAISNITSTDGTISGAYGVGGVVGKNFGSLDYATSSGQTVTGKGYVGGITGYSGAPMNSTATSIAEISYATSSGTVSGSGSYIGGVVGYNSAGSTITSSTSSGTVESTAAQAGATDIGGVVGYNAGSLTGVNGVVDFSGTVNGDYANNVGGVAGYNSGAIDQVTIANSAVSSSATNGNAGVGVNSIGGLVGLNDTGGTLTDATSGATVSASGAYAVGGVVGLNAGSVTTASYSGGQVQGDAVVGGLVGKNLGALTGGVATGNVNGGQYVGGVVGWNTGTAATVSASYSDNTVSGTTAVGGLVGESDTGDTISGSWALGSVNPASQIVVNGVGGGTGAGDFGGLVGYNAGTITTSYSAAAVGDGGRTQSAPIVLGGLIGENAGTVSDVYAIGPVTVSESNYTGYVVGGLVGQNDAAGSVTRAYASGALSADKGQYGAGGTATAISGAHGAVAGTNAGTLSNVYFDQVTTTDSNAVGNNTGTVSATAVGGSGASPYAQATYAGFDFANTWYIVDGSTRPFLRSEYSTTITNSHQLELMALNLGATYTLATDINGFATAGDPSDIWRNPTTADANGNYGFVPIGSDASPFTGTFLGGGDAIVGLTTVEPHAISVGLFGNLGSSALVTDLTLAEGHVAGLNAVGALTGKNAGNVFEATVADYTVTGANGVGGVVGKNFGTADYLAAEDVQVTGDGTYVGGVVGYNGVPQTSGATTQASLSNSFAQGGSVTDTAVNVENDVGGVVGYNDPYAVVLNVYAASNPVVGSGYAVGGLIGRNYGGISNSYAESTNVTGSAAVGGVVGENFGNVSYDSYVDGAVSGAEYVGGLVGYDLSAGAGSSNPIVYNSYFQYAVENATVNGTATANAEADVGGLVGYNDASGQISDISVAGVTTQGATVAGAGGSAYGGYAVGGLVGKNYGSIYNASAIAQSTTGSTAVGGVVGLNFGTVVNTTADGSVTGDEYVGGLVGYNGAPTTGTSSTSTPTVALSLFDYGTVTANGVGGAGTEADAGGLVGYNDATGLVTQSRTGTSNAATVTSAGNAVGGAVGKNYGSVTQVATIGAGEVAGHDSVGGLVGRNFGGLSQSLSSVVVAGADYVGGAVGYNGAPMVGPVGAATVDQVKATGAVIANSQNAQTATGVDFGGLLGWNAGTVTNAYSTGTVQNTSGLTNVGGFVGYNTGAISTSYTLSVLSTPTPVGGGTGTPSATAGAFAGDNAGTFTYDYYDIAKNGVAIPGVGTGSQQGLVGLTDAQAMTQSAYTGFDFTNIWAIGASYPYLQVESQIEGQ